MSTLRVEMLGGLQVVSTPESIAVRKFRTRRVALLLAFLAMKPGTAHSRDQLGEMLWPEEDPKVQRARLRYELSKLRVSFESTFGTALLADDGGHAVVALNADVQSDVAEFDGLVKRAARINSAENRIEILRPTVALYRGDLLPGYDVPEGCPPEFDWITRERQYFREAAYQASVKLISDLRTLGLRDEATSRQQEVNVLFSDLEEENSIANRKTTVSVRETLPRHDPVEVSSYVVSPPIPLLQGKFFGRDEEIRWLRQWAITPNLSKNSEQRSTPTSRRRPVPKRLVTLLGPGGIGKTRLLIEAILGRAEAVVVPLTSVPPEGNDAQIYEAISSALKIVRRPNLPLQQQVVEALRVRPDAILLLDNCEHVIAACARCVSELLRACPSLRIGVTSQRALGIAEEVTLEISPLPVSDAHSLFLDRAQAVRPDFARTPSAQEAAREITDLLGGMPLALELAAARAVFLGPQQMLAQLRERLNFLSSSHPARPTRHRSMRAVLQWSTSLLSDGACRTLAFLSLFRTGTTMEALQAVADADGTLLDCLEELRLCSLLIVRQEEADDADTAPTRFDLLFHVREFAGELLTTEDRNGGWERHAEFWIAQVVAMPDAFKWGRWEAIRQLVVPDIDNIRAAIDGCIRLGLSGSLVRLTERLGTVLLELGYWSDTELLLQNAEEYGQLSPEQLARILGFRGALDRRRGNEERARAAWERRLAYVRQQADPDMEATVLFDLAGQAIDSRDNGRALQLLDEGLAITERENLAFRSVVGRVLMARVLRSHDLLPDARTWALDAWTRLSTITANPTQTLYVIIHLLPVFRSASDDSQIAQMIRMGVPLALETEQAFLLARLLDEAWPFWEAEGKLNLAGLGLFISREIHIELGSRLAEQSCAAMEQFRKRLCEQVENLHTGGESLAWIREPRVLTWRQAIQELRTAAF